MIVSLNHKMKLHLLQLGDSALPIGGYSHSWGLEAGINRGLVRDPATLEKWVRDWLHRTMGPLEGVIVAVTCRAVEKKDRGTVVDANQLLDASLSPPTLRHASGEMGEQLLALAECWPWASESVSQFRQTINHPYPGRAADSLEHRKWHHAVIFGTLAAATGATPEEAVVVYLHQAILGVVSAGVRGIPIGHTHGQQIVARLHQDIEALATELSKKELETAGSFCPAYEILCHAQTQLYTRLFRS
jgi:urease accessory protein